MHNGALCCSLGVQDDFAEKEISGIEWQQQALIRPSHGPLPAIAGCAHAPRSPLSTALADCRHALIGVGLFSAVLNMLQLTGPIFMLEVYDRVIPSRSIPTLVGISILAAIMFGFQGLLDVVRGRVLVRIAGSIDETLSQRVYDIAAKLPLKALTPPGYQPLHDLDRIRSFMSTVGPAALFDLPWMPLYLAICFLFHPLIGITATLGAMILVTITLMTEFLSRQPAREASGLADSRMALAEASRRNAEVVQAMGMAGRLAFRWSDYNRRHLRAQQRVADITGGLGGLSRVLRQSAVLGIGAYLVVNQQASAGIIIASSILTSRALAPVEVAIANWRGFAAARQSWRRLNGLLGMLPTDQARMELPKPAAALTLEGVSVSPPGSQRLVVQSVAFQLKAGHGLGVIGPSASGKSSLARAIVGVWPTAKARSGSTVPRSISGRRKPWGRTSAICRRTWSCSAAPWPRTSRASMPTRRRTR